MKVRIIIKNKMIAMQKTVKKINEYLPKDEIKIQYNQVYTSELKLVMFLHKHNLPLLLMDHNGPLIKSIYPYSLIFKDITCGRTKATAITTQCLATENINILQDKITGNHFLGLLRVKRGDAEAICDI